jgi:hypothetical protein
MVKEAIYGGNGLHQKFGGTSQVRKAHKKKWCSSPKRTIFRITKGKYSQITFHEILHFLSLLLYIYIYIYNYI